MTRNSSIHLIPEEVLNVLTQKSRDCIDNLIDYLATLESADLSVLRLLLICFGNQSEILVRVVLFSHKQSLQLF